MNDVFFNAIDIENFEISLKLITFINYYYAEYFIEFCNFQLFKIRIKKYKRIWINNGTLGFYSGSIVPISIVNYCSTISLKVSKL